MAAPNSSSWSRSPGRLYWLPPGGIGNGLEAQMWAVLIDTDASNLVRLLATLRYAGIAAYAAKVGTPSRRRPSPVFRIWVDTWNHARAEDVIREVLLRQRRIAW